MASTTLAVVINGDAYIKYAEELFETAKFFFHPTEKINLLMLEGHEGWPAATMYRWHHLLDHFPKTDYVFLSDADMRFESSVQQEILPQDHLDGITAVQHPGYVSTIRQELPYEDRERSACYISPDEGYRYYCGGFVGGSRRAVYNLASQITICIDMDEKQGIIPRWHDESALNRALASYPPDIILSPSYCYPDNDWWYQTIWMEQYERKLVAIDKTEAERGERD